MRTQTDWVLDKGSKPFADFKSAATMRDQLNTAMGQVVFIIEEHPLGGFGLKKMALATTSEPQQRATRIIQLDAEAQAFVAMLPVHLRPALRNYFMQWILVLLGASLAIFPTSMLSSVVPEFILNPLLTYMPNIYTILSFAGLAVMGYAFLSIFLRVYSNAYTITRDGVKAQFGIISRNAMSVRFKDIRGVGLVQGIVDRLLGVGILEFYTAAEEGAEVVFRGVAKPTVWRDRVENYINQIK